MEKFVDVIMTVLVVLYLPFGGWLAVEVIKLRVEVAKIKTRCSDRKDWIENISHTATKTLNNVVKIAAKLDVDIKE